MAIVHKGNSAPTALAAPGDQYWLPVARRWATPNEIMNLYAIPADSPMRALLLPGGPTALSIAKCLGRAVAPHCAEIALRRALQRAPLPTPIRYASACSGIDTFAVAMDHVLGAHAWDYVSASESRPGVAAALARAWAPRGLHAGRILPDAADDWAILDALAADLWVFTPPCETFSRRNHARNGGNADALCAAAARDILAMLAYARIHRPAAIVVENVDEPDSESVISAALRSLPGYSWESVVLAASEYGPMERVRRYWVGARVA